MKMTLAREAWVICLVLPDSLKTNSLGKKLFYSLDLDSKIRFSWMKCPENINFLITLVSPCH